MKEEILLHTLSTGDPVIWRPDDQSIIVPFQEPRKVVSTSLLNGGYREDLTAMFNHNCGPDDGSCCTLQAGTYQEHMRVMATGLGLDPDRTTGMGTAALMENVAIASQTYQELVVTAIATAGVEGNAGRAGDSAHYYSPGKRMAAHRPGTINIMLVMDADMPSGIVARALVTCTEAKTVALQELMVGSLYSSGLATGSGTDQTVVVANSQSPLYFEGAGKHSKLGELIGLAVKQAVTEALQKQNGLFPFKQHSVLRRLKRFGVDEESLWQAQQMMPKDIFWPKLYQWERQEDAVTYTSLYVHLLDQLQWGLLSAAEVGECGNELLQIVGQKFGVEAPKIKEVDVSQMIKAWQQLILACLKR